MNYLKTDPVGIDESIVKVQKILFDELSTIWGIDIDGYGRIYKNKKGDKTIPEHYLGNNKYSGNLFNQYKTKFFFEVSDKSNFDAGLFTSDVSIYFIVDLDKTKVTPYRADEEVREQVFAILRKTTLRNIKSIDTGIDSVASSFSNILKDNAKWDDMQPFHVFKIVSELSYKLDNKNCFN